MKRATRYLTTLVLPLFSLAACDAGDILEPEPVPSEALLPATGAAGFTVMTRNLYLGGDIDAVIEAGASGFDAAVMAATQVWMQIQATSFPERAGALADEIQAADPHLIGLQEVTTYRIQVPSDMAPVTTYPYPNATTVVYDFLEILMDTLSARGMDYVVAAQVEETDVELPIITGMDPMSFADVRYTDHEVILSRGDVELGATTETLYDARLDLSSAGLPGERTLGFVAVEAVANGSPFLFVSTHLETQDYIPIQVAQAQQLLDWVGGQPLPIVLVGDLNSAANPDAPEDRKTPIYWMVMDDGFQDLWLRGHPYLPGLTCCHADDLVGEHPFDQRLDLILLNQGTASLVGGFHTAIVGIDPDGRTPSGLWPSDHAGLVATLRLPRGLDE